VTVLLVSGTGTGVGKTVVTAAVAALSRHRGESVAVVKPAQTGRCPGEPGDLQEIGRLSGLGDESLHEFARYPDPLSPEAAARFSGLPALSFDDVARLVHKLSGTHDLVLVEGAGGLLVRFSAEGWTMADLGQVLRVPVLVVTAAGLGALNATALTLEVLAARGLRLGGLVIGSWPRMPDLAACSNLHDLPVLAAEPLAGVLPEGAARRPDFLRLAAEGLGPGLGGRFDAAHFNG
jgi:dethiobiotin synthetase